MTGPGQPSSDGDKRRAAVSAQPSAQGASSDFLLAESRGTRQEADPPPRRPRQAPGSLATMRQAMGRFLSTVERRRLASILNGAAVLTLTDSSDSSSGGGLALRHRHWSGLSVRLAGVLGALIVAIFVTPAVLALAALSALHGGVIAIRRGVTSHWGLLVGGADFVAGWLLAVSLGTGMLRAALIVAALVAIVTTVVAWQVDMELLTDNGVLVRTRGLLFLKRTIEAPVSSIRIADVSGPIFGLGLVTVDTTSDRDQLLHHFGLIRDPNQWTTTLLRAANRPAVTSPSGS